MRTLEWNDGVLRLIDQQRLPLETVILECRTYQDVALAIREMRVRGAPAIGVTAAYGVVLGALEIKAQTREAFLRELRKIADYLQQTRPTAVNLSWALERMLSVAARSRGDNEEIKRALLVEAQRMAEEDELANRRLASFGAELIKDGANILTHCNTGSLATVHYGTALGVIRTAWGQGKRIHIFVDETRPLLQGARLTAWELTQDGIPMTLITDNMAGYFMRKGQINLAIVGADRIAANGDFANKIGTYTVAVLAKEHGVPFYTAAPTSTIDLSLASGEGIPIEERSPDEVVSIRGVRIAPEGVRAANPAFDVTPARYLAGIITENGIVRPPYEEGLRRVVELRQGHGLK
ncbi:MAG: S-methyl-5-thioribose-1-phosphate isomerase [Chloroflexi bacterium]|nr:S-methyl-5-thioribose-1-phosphate isomerase [Chloroflexota bacterium]MCL5074023.1 S-methyl-5-thioribose-1-phosphate isomerase [Chloroflexota bacterium]